MSDQRHYGLFLTEGDFGDSVYAFSFTSEELADWIEAPVEFPEDESSTTIENIPGTEHSIRVTIGSTANDKLIGLTNVEDGYPHPWLKATASEDEDEAYEELVELCGEEYIYEGLVY